MSEHLTLPFHETEYERQPRKGGGGFKPREDRIGFSKEQKIKIEEITAGYEKDKGAYEGLFEPNLLFKIEINQPVDEGSFIKFLRRNNIQVIAPSPSGKGYWVLLAEEANLNELIRRLELYGGKERYKDFDAIEGFEPIPDGEKLGEQLRDRMLEDDEEAFLDIEIWRLEDDRMKDFLASFSDLLSKRKGEVADSLLTENLCLLRVRIDGKTLRDIITLKEISRIDRPPRPYISIEQLSSDIEELDIGNRPSENAAAIAIIDSGILSGHPLLENAVGDEIALPHFFRKRNLQEDKVDDIGHGTKVAGIAIYGDIKQCLDDRVFHPEVWLLSAKLMYQTTDEDTGEIRASYDESMLLEHQLERAVRYFVDNYHNCRVVNISFGSKYYKMYGNRRQFALATLIDELARELDIVFVISAGNINPFDYNFPDEYPDYLINEEESVKITNPASSALAITVGSINHEFLPSDLGDEAASRSFPSLTNYPSPFTCVGPGYRGMVKPDLVEEGGNHIPRANDPGSPLDLGSFIPTLNPKWLSERRLFDIAQGTSFSSPKVANYVARLFNRFPGNSANLTKAIILASAEIPKERPAPLDSIRLGDPDRRLMDLLKVYGYGKPNFSAATASEMNRILLLADRSIRLNKVHLYYFFLPQEFIEVKGRREISVTLVYNPPVRRSRIEYMGVSMEFHLFRDSELREVLHGYQAIKIDESLEGIVPEELALKRIDLKPGVTTRKRSVHQKGIKSYVNAPRIDPSKPLILAVISQNRWVSDEDYEQDYAVVAAIKHEARIDIYSRVRSQIQARIRI